MKNKRGFTLVELLVVIAIVAILSITIGVGSQTISHSADKTEGRDTLGNLFAAARIYYELSSPKTDEECSTICSGSGECSIPIYCLILNGLIDSETAQDTANNIEGVDNPLKSDGTKLIGPDVIKVYIDDNGVKYASFTSGKDSSGNDCIVTDAELYSTDKTVKDSVNSKIGGCS